jgi:hypothetical protein
MRRGRRRSDRFRRIRVSRIRVSRPGSKATVRAGAVQVAREWGAPARAQRKWRRKSLAGMLGERQRDLGGGGDSQRNRSAGFCVGAVLRSLFHVRSPTG